MKLHLMNVRLSFPNLFEPTQVNGEGKPAYSASFLLPPDDPQIDTINDVIDKVAEEKWKAKAKTILAQMRGADKVCLHNGDMKADYDGYAGYYYVSARNAARPLVINRDKTPLTAEDGKPYGGCYVNAVIDVWAQDNQWGKRVNATLSGVQFLRDGDAFAAGAPASVDEFDDLGVDAEASGLA